MSPPAFVILEEQSRKLFTKGFAHGQLKFKSKTAVQESVFDGKEQKVVFKTGAAHDLATRDLLGSLIIKYHFPQQGAVVTEKWDTTNTLSSSIVIKDALAKDLKLAFSSTYLPHLRKHDGFMKCEYGREHYKVSMELYPSSSPFLALSGVVSLNEWYVGAQAKLNIAPGELVSTNFCFGRQNDVYRFHSYLENGNSFGANLYLKLHKHLELGARLGWVGGTDTTAFGLVSKYAVSDKLTVLAKLDDKSVLNISTAHKLSSDVKLVLSTEFGPGATVDTNRFGAALVYSPK